MQADMRPIRRRRRDRARSRARAVQRLVVVAAMIAFALGATVSGGEIGVYSAQGASWRRRCAGLCKWRWPCLARQFALRMVLVRVYS